MFINDQSEKYKTQKHNIFADNWHNSYISWVVWVWHATKTQEATVTLVLEPID